MGNSSSKQVRKLNKEIKAIPKLDLASGGVKQTIEAETKQKIYTSRPTPAQDNTFPASDYSGEVSKSRESFVNKVKNMSRSSEFIVKEDKFQQKYDPNHPSLDFINNREKIENQDSTKFIQANELSNLIKSFKRQHDQQEQGQQQGTGNIKILKELVDSGFINLPSYKVSINSTALNQSPVKEMDTNKDSKSNRIQIVKDSDDSLSLEDQDKQSKQTIEEFKDLEEIVKNHVKLQHPSRKDNEPIHRKKKSGEDVKVFL